MQAPPLSSTAARIPPPTSLSHAFAQTALAGTEVRSRPRRPPPALAVAAGLAHDASNLLAGLGLYCDLLERPGVLQAAHSHYATELRLLSYRSSGLIRSLIDQLNPELPGLYPKNAGAPPLHVLPSSQRPGPGPDLAASLHEIAPLLAALAAPCARLVLDAPDTLPTSSFPRSQVPFETLERIVVNLVTNAAQAVASSMAKSGCIWVVLRLARGSLYLEVEDNGPGMTAAAANAFLHPSPMGPGARRGFGHRILHELVQSTGAELSIRRRSGGGTAFAVVWSPTSLRRAAKPSLTPNRKKAQPC